MKGEWKARSNEVYTEEGEYRTTIARIFDRDHTHLIAAAPKMAKFLENLCVEYEDYDKIDESFYRSAKRILEEITNDLPNGDRP